MGISVLFLTLKSDNVIQVCLFIKLEMCVYDLKKKKFKERQVPQLWRSRV